MRESDFRLRLYRGQYCAYWKQAGQTRRRSLRTSDPVVARSRFADFVSTAALPGETAGEIAAAYLAERDHTAIDNARLRNAWRALSSHFAELRPDQISPAICRGYIAARRADGRADGTILKELRTLRAALRWFDPASPARFEFPPSPPPRLRHLSRAEYQRLLDACRAPHLRLFVILALATAARAGALLSLTWDRVDFARGLIDLAVPSPGDRRKGRAIVPMTASARAALIEAQRQARTDFVIEFADRPLARINQAFRRAARAAELPDVTPHSLRHTAAVWMAEAGVPMPAIAAYLGHSDSRITETVYAKFSPEYLRGAAAALEAPDMPPAAVSQKRAI